MPDLGIRPEPDVLRSLDALERSIRALPQHEPLLPTPVAPAPDVLDEWLTPYRSWHLPAVYLDFIARYGGVATDVPPVGIGIRPLAKVLASRRRRDALGRTSRFRSVKLCPGNIDGELCLLFPDDAVEPRVALMVDDDDITCVADSFAMYLWSVCFFFGAVDSCRFREHVSFAGVAVEHIERFIRRFAAELERAGFELLGADSSTLCGQRGGTRVWVGNRAPNVRVSLGNRGSVRAVAEARTELLGLLERCRCGSD